MERQDPARVVGDWLNGYERSANVDPERMQALKQELQQLSPRQLERFAAWLQERQSPGEASEEPRPRGNTVRGFGLQSVSAGQPPRRMSLPGLRFIRAGF